VTVAIMAGNLSPAERGYFYTFGSVLALQVYFELSLHVVIINVSSHLWAYLKLDDSGTISGDPATLARLISFGRTLAVWYLLASILFAVGIGAGGAWFLAQQSLPRADWLAQWLSVVVLTAGLLVTLPLTAMLEGCDQLRVVNRYRFLQAATGSVVVWILVVGGGGLWAAVGSAAVRLAWELHLICVRYRGFFRPFLTRPAGERIAWKAEIWPLQWRMAIQGIGTWWAFYLMTPVIFHYHGDAAAGRMGMTWSVLNSIQAAASAWIETRRPKLGQLAALGEYRELDAMFLRYMLMSTGLLAVAALGFLGFVTATGSIDHWLAGWFADALLPPLPTAILVLATVIMQIPRCQTIYVRSHMLEPFLIPSTVTNALLGLSVWWLGKEYGAVGAATAWLTVITLIHFPWWMLIWNETRGSRPKQPSPDQHAPPQGASAHPDT